jgi:hypothetical protein
MRGFILVLDVAYGQTPRASTSLPALPESGSFPRRAAGAEERTGRTIRRNIELREFFFKTERIKKPAGKSPPAFFLEVRVNKTGLSYASHRGRVIQFQNEAFILRMD